MASIKHECAVCGVANCSENAVSTCIAGLIAQQHRGHEWWGIAGENKGKTTLLKYPGLVKESCTRPEVKDLEGDPVIGHDRYSTAGSSNYINAQPHWSKDTKTILCANGDVVPSSYYKWSRQLTQEGFAPISQNDAELLLRVIEWRLSLGGDIVEAIRFVQEEVVGAFSALMIHDGQLIAFRDPLGIRPLVYGRMDGLETVLLASETCALDEMGVHSFDYIKAGEIRLFERDGQYKLHRTSSNGHAHCVFELIYFSFPTSYDFGIPVGRFREESGAKHIDSIPEGVDFIAPVPDSSNPAAIGLAQVSGYPFGLALIRSHYAAGRSFIDNNPEMRGRIARQKNIPHGEIVNGSKFVLVDDSIVRGTTSKQIIRRLLDKGAKEIHMRIVSPKIVKPCYYGIDTPRQEELIAANLSEDEICNEIGATSLKYLSIDDLKEVIHKFGKKGSHYCFACFGDDYPTPI
jgi:amidophosphoribosyltransferase